MQLKSLLPDLDRRTARHAIEFVYANLLDVSRVMMIYPIIICWIFWGDIDTWLNLLWGAASLSVYVARMLMTLAYRKQNEADDNPWKWGRLFTFSSLVSGLLWGVAPWLFYSPDAQTELVVLYVLIVGTAAGAVMISSYWLPGYLLYAIPAVSMMIACLVFNGDSNERVLAFMLTLFLFMLISVSRKSRDQAYNGIRLRFENLDLIERLNQEKSRAEDANRAKTKFLASANHDLRQPVHALSLLSFSLKEEIKSEKGSRIFTQLSQTVTNLNKLLESLLDLSQLEAGAVNVTPTRIQLYQLAEQLRSEFLSLSTSKRLTFKIHQSDGEINTDQTLLIRLLRNLLHNAVRYTDKGGVLLAFRKVGSCVRFEVWDTGIGIDAHQQAEIFREFYQVGNQSRNAEHGLGLGLSICQKLAELLGTSLSLKSIPGKGSVFRFDLPLINTVASDVPQFINTLTDERKLESVGDEYPTLKGLTALVIDDDLIGLSAVSGVLESFGMHTVLAQSKERAIELLSSSKSTDLLISDFRLSENTDGIETVSKLRSVLAKPELPALILTGDTAPAVLTQIKDSGIPYLHKPVKPFELAVTLSQLLEDEKRAR